MMRIAETNEYKRLAVLFQVNGLEIDPDDPVPPELIKCWKLVDDEKPAPDGEPDFLAGGCVLCLREGEHIIDGIAVDPHYRDTDWGSKLLALALAEAAARGGPQMYLVARAPGFFKKHGFETVKRDDAPEFFECFTCEQYQKSCFPEVMKKEI